MPEADWDIVIVGGGPAGLSTALHLAAEQPELAGRTLVLEKHHYPREKYCAGGLGGRALARLAALGLPLSVPAVPFQRVILRAPDGDLTVEEPGFGVVVRRIEFDHSLARAAVARGITLREGAVVKGVEPGEEIAKVVLADGETIRAKVVVGADGVGGVTRRCLGLDGGHLRAQVIECDTLPAEGDPPRDTLLFDAADPSLGGYGWDFPTLVDGEERVCRGLYAIRVLGAENVRDRLRTYLARRGLCLEDHRLKPFGERGFETGRLSAPRVFLVGEAAGIDIATGEGIAQAIDDGALASRVLGQAFARGRFDFEDWGAVVRRSRLGLGLLGRLLMYRTFYPDRDRTSRMLRDNPAILRIFARDFAGASIPPGLLASAALRTRISDVPWLLGVARESTRGW